MLYKIYYLLIIYFKKSYNNFIYLIIYETKIPLCRKATALKKKVNKIDLNASIFRDIIYYNKINNIAKLGKIYNFFNFFEKN